MLFRVTFALVVLSVTLPVTAQVAWKDKINVSVLMHADGRGSYETVEAKALQCGADAIVIRSTGDQTVKPLRGGIDQGARLEALAIRYTDDKG